MKKTVSFDQTLPIERVIKKYFPSNAKLYIANGFYFPYRS